MSASCDEVKAHVYREHARLRSRSAELARAALVGARTKHRIEVRALVDELRTALEEHDALETRELVPLLVHADAWGPERVERLRGCHAAHLRAVRTLSDELGEDSATFVALVERVEMVVSGLLTDLDDEEATYLDAHSLGIDLPIFVEQETG